MQPPPSRPARWQEKLLEITINQCEQRWWRLSVTASTGWFKCCSVENQTYRSEGKSLGWLPLFRRAWFSFWRLQNSKKDIFALVMASAHYVFCVHLLVTSCLSLWLSLQSSSPFSLLLLFLCLVHLSRRRLFTVSHVHHALLFVGCYGNGEYVIQEFARNMFLSCVTQYFFVFLLNMSLFHWSQSICSTS